MNFLIGFGESARPMVAIVSMLNNNQHLENGLKTKDLCSGMVSERRMSGIGSLCGDE